MACTFNKDCPIRMGFEVYFSGEEDEKAARDNLLPTLRQLFKLGSNLKEGLECVKSGKCDMVSLQEFIRKIGLDL